MKAQTRFWKAVDAVEKPVRAVGCFPSAVLVAASVVVISALAWGPGLAASVYAALVGLLCLVVGRTWRDDQAARTRADLEAAQHLLAVRTTDGQRTVAMSLVTDEQLTEYLPTIKREAQ